MLAAQHDMCNQMVTSINMPKRELVAFEGDSLSYQTFMCNFDSSIDCLSLDDKVKLSYLIQYCKGEAKETIDHYLDLMCCEICSLRMNRSYMSDS